MPLSEQQVDFFHAFGFLKLPGLFADVIDELIDAFEQVWRERGGGHDGKAHDGTARSVIVPFIDQHERLCALLDDARLLEVATTLLGEDFNYILSDGNFYVGDTPWHSDTWDMPYLTIKHAFYLDRVTSDTGCLRVIPGSHRQGDDYADALQAQVGQSEELWDVQGRDVPCVALEVQPGDLLLFNRQCKHASFGGGSRRRMFTINLYQRIREQDLQRLRDEIATRARFWSERAYGETMIRTASPARLRHLEQVMANDGHLAELARKARREMAEPSRG
jgi:ectoine hydroxylase-related dioxygenase (phytanoyl-CoA dioxygenase family)